MADANRWKLQGGQFRLDKDSVARAVVNTVSLEPGNHLPGRLELYSEKSMALEMRSLSAYGFELVISFPKPIFPYC